MFSLIWILSAGLLWQVAFGAIAQFSNKRRFLFDVDGNMIDAYGSKINCKYISRDSFQYAETDKHRFE